MLARLGEKSAQTMNFHAKILMVVCLLRLLSWLSPALTQTLPCLDSK
ncbi:exported hypothetical protein [Microcystis aeruginosa PCC 9807]|uniref:Uncharacterized protein n=1 Tax=Microcystis aeruginosa PCC 9807 TaxID=1160283 RepID=I4H1N7_MICAE|nr:exported hypothetical protein [Microcystis aeruginosa PCC 9807]